MDSNGILQILIYILLIVVVTPLLGGFMARLFGGERVLLSPVLGPVERSLYKICGVNAAREQHWAAYALSLLMFNLAGVLVLYGLQRLQAHLPFNPAAMAAIAPDLAFNTAISFVTNTNWQAYGGETAMSYLVQMAGFTVQNFVSAATGIAVAVALIRGFARNGAKSIGNFYVDLTRAVLYLLLPLCVVGALVLVWQGVPQNLSTYVEATTLEGGAQVIAQGPVASQMMIKHLGTNGGGFFNANAAHPYENPTALVNLLHMVAIFAIGAGLTNTFGRMVGDQRQGWAILGAMGVLFVIGVAMAYWAEAQANPALVQAGAEAVGSLEGKEVRFGTALSALFAVITTAASCGAVNAMHDSLMPLAGMVPLVNMMLGEIVVGGVGAGFYGMMVFVILTVFIAGLMVGRTPEYLGKKIEAREVKLAIIAMLVFPLGVLGLGAVGLLAGAGSIPAGGPHGLSEVLYAYTSATANNGSAFGGFGANTLLHNVLLALAMWFGRFVVILALLAVAGSVAAKRTVPPSSGTFPTQGGLFVGLLVGVIVVVGGLTFFPVLALGPIVEHLLLSAGTLF
ncbi:potassium-transporting ATPase subunit KdpA [Magnetospirillum gryphiswaldense]|uniref:Potassium-transporting ATPase potassium-binding subunit n=1 Tax=Magnetospirillum gryphiswaldense TaxID=55518 RepID=A4U5M4_9PROT|nr:potassium-transporting ATPase subunit KdpA [Magnetospirillum gryphiswaldense]AVM72999.1 Potassium-transporting ATPase A chain [Magnetospirillum gryphiswaldense MSR-1]AVM76902.1 Potassium-transporting ATPase A chain [Magnetospirillum gryphiswaldense]CAM78181.1 Potassium-transporting ATPase A chain [Magnetospirillum gryphiswaldense MSR-1]